MGKGLPALVILLVTILTLCSCHKPTVPTPPPSTESGTSIPTTIRVLRVATGQIEEVEFKSYVKNVLPNEWFASWEMDALKAGAMAVKTYAWYWTMHQKYPGENYDVKDTTADQVYKPGTSHSQTDKAVDETWDYIMTKEGATFQAQYDSGTQGSSDPKNLGRMSQWGTQYWAEKGKNWQSILHYYYDPIEIVALATPTQTNVTLTLYFTGLTPSTITTSESTMMPRCQPLVLILTTSSR